MLKNSSAIFPGSFDPFTNGHVDIVNRSLKLVDTVVVAVLENSTKKELFTVPERVAMIKEVFIDKPKVVVESFSGLLVDYARRRSSTLIIRGLRAISDYDYEAQMALMNKNLDAELETCFLVAREQNSYISSTLVKQIAPYGADVSTLVPAAVVIKLKEKFKESYGSNK